MEIKLGRCNPALKFIFYSLLHSICSNAIGTTHSKLGTFEYPLLYNLISFHHNCQIHILFDTLHTQNLDTTRKIPITISNLMNNASTKNIFSQRGWTCEFMIIYAKRNPSKLWNWLDTYNYNYIIDPGQPMLGSQTLNGPPYILLLASNKTSNDALITKLSGKIQQRNNFAILYLPRDITAPTRFCVRMRVPTNAKFKCNSLKFGPITVMFFFRPEPMVWRHQLHNKDKGYEEMEMKLFSKALTSATGLVKKDSRALYSCRKYLM